MKKFDNPQAYFDAHHQWKSILNPIRDILISKDVEETIKWYLPAYLHHGKNIIGFGCFKKWVALWFHQGSFLGDPHNVLVNAQEGKTISLRQWRFEHPDQLKLSHISSYVDEAIENSIQGLEIKPQRNNGPIVIPKLMQDDFNVNVAFGIHFEKLSLANRRAYIEYIISAKKIETKKRRLVKIRPMIFEGIGLNDKYKKK